MAEIENVDALFPDDGHGQTVLEIGLERGFKSIALTQANYRVFGLDFAADRIAARQEMFYRPSGIDVRLCDVTVETIPHDGETFDYVMLNGVLEHWYCNPFHALTEIRRVLRPGGTFILETPNAANLRKRIWLAAGRYPYTPLKAIHTATHPHAFHHREHTMRELVWLAAEAGFEVNRRLFRDSFHRAAPSVLRRMYWGVTRMVPSFRDKLILVSRKPA
jgi:SAM-dependent methyltransferase